MNIQEEREIYGEQIIRELYGLCPGCGADNVPKTFDWLPGQNPLRICPICKTDRTPTPYMEEEHS